MAMSKADYEMLACLFRDRCGQSYIDNGTVAALVADLCKELKYRNPRFNAETFIRAATTPEVNRLIERVPTVMDYGPPIVEGVAYYPAKEVWDKR